MVYQQFANQQIMTLIRQLAAKPDVKDHEVECLLNTEVMIVLNRELEQPAKLEALRLLRSNPGSLAVWLSERFPTISVAVTETLTRSLLSLTVE